MCFGKNLGKGLAILFAGLSAVCGVLVYAVPDLAVKILEYLTHSIWQLTLKPFNILDFGLGLVLWAVIGFVLGTVLSKLCKCENENK